MCGGGGGGGGGEGGQWLQMTGALSKINTCMSVLNRIGSTLTVDM